MRSLKQLSVVVPVFNEQAVLAELTEAVLLAAAPVVGELELVLVNDGSTDGSGQVMDDLATEDDRIRVVHLARNFGHQAAVHAGLSHAQGQAVVVMDADMQDDPAAIPRFVEQWQTGDDVVYAIRVGRKEALPKRMLFDGFYRMLNTISDTELPMDAGNFGLMDRRVVAEVLALAERDRYLPGLRGWVGFQQTGIQVERMARYDDTPRVSLRGLIHLAKTAIFSFSGTPLTVFYVIAGVSALVMMGLMGFTLYHKLFTGLAISGWTSMMITMCFFGGLNALGIAVTGEYVIRIYNQVRARPVFIVDRTVNLKV